MANTLNIGLIVVFLRRKVRKILPLMDHTIALGINSMPKRSDPPPLKGEGR